MLLLLLLDLHKCNPCMLCIENLPWLECTGVGACKKASAKASAQFKSSHVLKTLCKKRHSVSEADNLPEPCH